MVLFLFVIMLVNLDEAAKERQFNRQWWLALACVAGGGAGARSTSCARGAGAFQAGRARGAAPAPGVGNTEQLADVLFSRIPAAVRDRLAAAAGGGGRLGGHGEEEDLTRCIPITTVHYLVLSAALLLIGTVGVLTRRNIVIILMSIELILNAVNINLIAFSQHFEQRQRADLRHLRDHRRGGRSGRGAGHPDRAVPQQGNGAGRRNRPAEVVGARR